MRGRRPRVAEDSGRQFLRSGSDGHKYSPTLLRIDFTGTTLQIGIVEKHGLIPEVAVPDMDPWIYAIILHFH